MIETAENVRREYGIRRKEQDEYALRVHQRAVAAWERARSQDEVVPVTVRTRRATSSSAATSTRAPTPPSKAWRSCGP